MNNLRFLVENTIFGVCVYLGRKMNIPSKSVRMFFIYTSFFTFGSPIIIYFIIAFWVKIKTLINGKRNPVWDL